MRSMLLQALLGLFLISGIHGAFAQDASALAPMAAPQTSDLPPTAPAPATSIEAPSPDAAQPVATVTPPTVETGAPIATPAPAPAVVTRPAVIAPVLKVEGAPFAWQLNLGPSASTIENHLVHFHNILLVVITVITAFVFILLLYTMVRFRHRPGIVPSTRTHHMVLEVTWTIVPIFILIFLAFYSFPLMYYMDRAKNPELTIKVTGHQWYWGYEYPDLGIDEYASNIIPEDKLQKGQLRLLSVDDPLIVPVDTDVQFLITGADVIHSWYMPYFGINRSGIPGRINEAWARVTKPGIYYGQCTKICGINHGYMPIEVRAVPKDVFKAWAAAAKTDGVDKANAQILGLKTADADAPGAKFASVK